MEHLRIIWLLAIGLSLACLFGYLAQRAKQSPILGYLLAGYLIGPHSPGFVADSYMTDQLAIIGVTLLMFAVGLNFNWKDLLAVKYLALPGALLLSSISIIAGTFYSIYLGESWLSGLVIGLAVCVSSTVVIVRVLSDQNLLQTKSGHLVVGWTIVEDLISVFGLLMLPALVQTPTIDNQIIPVLMTVLWVLFKIAVLGLIVYFVGEKLIEKFLKSIARTRSHELFTLAILACTFLIAIGSSYIFGVSLALGAFIAGTIVGKTDMSHQAAANALPMRDVFAVIFFLSVGMLFNPMQVTQNLPLFFGILCILLLLRPLIAFLIVTFSKYPIPVAFTVALAISQIGEYSFILAEEGSRLGILPDNAYDILVACAFISIGLNPILFKIFRPLFNKNSSHKSLKMQNSNKESSKPNVIVIGFGPIGQVAVKHLREKSYFISVIDQNIDTISSLKENNIQAVFGDATQVHILEKANLEHCKLFVITVPDFNVTKAIIKIVQRNNPFIPIIARIRFKADIDKFLFENVFTFCDEEATSEKLDSLIHNIIN